MKKDCIICREVFEPEQIVFNNKTIVLSSMCDSCTEKELAEAQNKSRRERQIRLENDFWATVPPLYRETDPKRLNPILVSAVADWQYSPKGIGFRGESGAGKTRAAVLILKKVKLQDMSVMFLKATDLTRIANEQFNNDYQIQNEAKRLIRMALTSKLVLIDDIGKGRMSPSSEELLYDILDKRSERQLPIVWTANATARQLHDTLSEDRGDAIMRRLTEFTKVISI